jgi:transketolase
LPTVAVEAGHPETWWRYVGREGRIVGIARFGESAPAAALFAHFGITVDAVVAAVRESLGGAPQEDGRVSASSRKTNDS